MRSVSLPQLTPRLTPLILAATAALALSACQKTDGEAAKTDPAKTETAAPATTTVATASGPQSTIPTESLSGQAAIDAQKLRHDNFEKLGDAMKSLSRQAKSDSPDMTEVKNGAGIVMSSATALPSWFAPGTGPDAGKTDAKANIWQNQDDFKAKAAKLYEVSQSLNDAANSGDAAAFKAAMAPIGAACKACHETYRVDD